VAGETGATALANRPMFSHPLGGGHLTDSVRCSADSPNTFSCEVQIDSDFESLVCESPGPEPTLPLAAPPLASPPPPPPDPAVSSLVSSFVSRTLVPAPPAPLISAAALLACASSELGLVLAASAGKNPVLAALTMLKASFDTSSCLTLFHNQAVQHNAEAYCADQGGVVVAVQGDKTICEAHEKAR